MIKNINKCYGCGACLDSCPKGSIFWSRNSLGFNVPAVDESTCIRCNICDKVCQATSPIGNCHSIDEYACYSFVSPYDEENSPSSSSGAFFYIAKQYLSLGFSIYGAAYSDNHQIVHKRAVTEEGIKDFQGSKYAQSDLSGVFKEINNDLSSGKNVLFSGTACQIAAVESYVHFFHLPHSIIFIQIICHGVSSPGMLKDFFAYEGEKEKDVLLSIQMRDRKEGWTLDKEKQKLVFKTKTLEEPILSNETYFSCFLGDHTFRETCYACKAKETFIADIILGDFLGGDVKLASSNFGSSLIFARSGSSFDCVSFLPKFGSLKLENKEFALKNNLLLRESASKNPHYFKYRKLIKKEKNLFVAALKSKHLTYFEKIAFVFSHPFLFIKSRITKR